ncbi:MAG: hypothetical protein DHS20C11_30020 [Lysobacteraceae bacterium]|nr:MAG: hypothetical protein DHS20C11_30020 [Xanthomonadaceae bacterium]
MQKLFAVALLLTLGACASIPLGTMLRFATFDAEDLQTVNPGEIRAAVRTHRDVEFGGATLRVEVGLREEAAPRIDESFDLEQLPQFTARGLGLAMPPEDRQWIVFSLADEDVDRFRSMQNALVEITNVDGEKSLSLGVSTSDGNFPDGMHEVPFAVDLRLFEEDGFFTLIKETDIEIDRSDDGDS